MDDVVLNAVALHRSGKLPEAEDAYRSILEDRPDDPDVCHFYGMLLFQTGKYEAGMESVRRALELVPNYAGALNNLANMKMKYYQLDEAEALYQRSAELDEQAVEPRLNLGVIARAKQEYPIAEQMYKSVLSLDPDHLVARVSLSNLYTRLKEFAQALDILKHCLELPLASRDEINILEKMGRLCQLLGKQEESVAIYSHWTKKYPDDTGAVYMLAAATGENIPEKADGKYVKDLFDRFAGTFDEVLDNLEYKGPEFVQEIVEKYYPESTGALTIVDAGCGTGLCGHFLKPRASRLVGVDISKGMLERARFREEYHELIEAEITGYFTRTNEVFDLIVSADTLCYFGDLKDFLVAAASSMHEQSRLVFTVEQLGDSGEEGYKLQQHGRYCHRRDYLLEALDSAQLRLETIEERALRLERWQPVQAYVISATRGTS